MSAATIAILAASVCVLLWADNARLRRELWNASEAYHQLAEMAPREAEALRLRAMLSEAFRGGEP